MTESNSESSTQEPNKKSLKLTKSNRNVYAICGHNGAALVEPILNELGWTKNTEKNSEDFRLKWTELVSSINYKKFREGEQMVNHIPNCGLITNKLGLLMSLRSHERSVKDTNRGKNFELNQFLPETYVIDDVKEREKFFSTFKEGDIWINKPTGLNQGKGISLIRDIDEFKKELEDRDNVSRSTMSGVKARIVQRYIKNPLLLEERKFDIRCYFFIASTVPYLVMYCPGYIRLSMNQYSNDDLDLITHLTNQFIQKKSPNYQNVKDDTIWSMQKFNSYLNETYQHQPNYKLDWARNVLDKRMQQIMLSVFQCVKNKFSSRVGFFEIYGFDFMIDTDFKVWLIEVNVNPALHTNCQLLKEILPPMVKEVILLAVECFEKVVVRKRTQLLPLDNQKLFTLLYSESTNACRNRVASYTTIQSWIPPRYRSSSQSPHTSSQSSTAQSVSSVSNSSTGAAGAGGGGGGGVGGARNSISVTKPDTSRYFSNNEQRNFNANRQNTNFNKTNNNNSTTTINTSSSSGKDFKFDRGSRTYQPATKQMQLQQEGSPLLSRSKSMNPIRYDKSDNSNHHDRRKSTSSIISVDGGNTNNKSEADSSKKVINKLNNDSNDNKPENKNGRTGSSRSNSDGSNRKSGLRFGVDRSNTSITFNSLTLDPIKLNTFPISPIKLEQQAQSDFGDKNNKQNNNNINNNNNNNNNNNKQQQQQQQQQLTGKQNYNTKGQHQQNKVTREPAPISLVQVVTGKKSQPEPSKSPQNIPTNLKKRFKMYDRSS